MRKLIFDAQRADRSLTKVKRSGQKTGCKRCASLHLYCKYEISMVGKVPGLRCRGRKISLAGQSTVVGANQTVDSTATPPPSTADTVTVAARGSPQQPTADATSQTYVNLAKTPSPFASREEEGYFDMLSNGDFDYIQLPDVNVDVTEASGLVDHTLGNTGSGVSEQSQGPWFTSAQSESGMNPSHGGAFDSPHMATSISGPSISSWASAFHSTTVQDPTCSSAVSAHLTPSDTLPPPSQTVPIQAPGAASERPSTNREELDHMTACSEMMRNLVNKEAAKMDTLDITLGDCKEYIKRLGEIIRDDEFERSTACRSLACTTVNLVIGMLERCIVVDTPSQLVDADLVTQIVSPPASCTASSTPPESRLRQKFHFRRPLPSVSFGALQYSGREQLVFCSNLMQTEASRALRLVRLLQHRQAGNARCQASASAARIQDLWCKDFITRLHSLLHLLGQEQSCEV